MNTDEIRAVLAAATPGPWVVTNPRDEEPTEVVDLVAALRASVEAARRRREAGEKP